MLYRKAWERTYNTDSGYTKVFITQQGQLVDRAPTKQGNVKKVLTQWKRTYTTNNWQKYAPYNNKGDFNRPYILFKHKNLLPETKESKWFKARPIAPQTKHPMSKLFHLTGRAWSFITANLEGEHFVINSSSKLPKFFERAQEKLKPKGDLEIAISDVEGCFPSMNKDMISLGLRKLTAMITENKGYDCVYVPRRGKKPCTWSTTNKSYACIPFSVLHDVVTFVLNNTYVKDFERVSTLLLIAQAKCQSSLNEHRIN